MSTAVTTVQHHILKHPRSLTLGLDRPSCPTPEQQTRREWLEVQPGLPWNYNSPRSHPSVTTLFTPNLTRSSRDTPHTSLVPTPSFSSKELASRNITWRAFDGTSNILQLTPRTGYAAPPSTPVSDATHLSPSPSTPRLTKRARTRSSSIKTREEFTLLIRLLEWLGARLQSMDTIRWDDFPWPTIHKPSTLDEITLRSVSAYILSQYHDGTTSRLDRLKEQFSTWQSRSNLLDKVINCDREKVEKGVQKVIKYLSFLLYQQASMPVRVRTADDAIKFTIPAICTKFAEITSDRAKYQAFLKLRKNDAQRILDSLQMLLDKYQIETCLKHSMLVALLRLSKKSGLYPQCFTLKGVKRGPSAVAAGHFGEVWKGELQEKVVCLKIVKAYQKSQITQLVKAYSREAILWSHQAHPNLLPFYGIYHLDEEDGRICLVSPWMDSGDINTYLTENPDVNRLLLVSDIAQGLHYLHKNNIVHGDLKGANILINASERACLADFGLSTVMDADVLKWTSIETSAHGFGTVRWQAPELIDPDHEDAKASKPSDIYAFACVCYEIFTGRVPFYEAPREATVTWKFMQGERPSQPPPDSQAFLEWGLTDEIWKFMECCWVTEPQARMTSQKVIEELPQYMGGGTAILPDTRPGGAWGELSSDHFRFTMHGGSGHPSIDELIDVMSLL